MAVDSDWLEAGCGSAGSPESVASDVGSSAGVCTPRGKRPRLAIESFFAEPISRRGPSLDSWGPATRTTPPSFLPVDSDGINIDQLFATSTDSPPLDHSQMCRRLFDLPEVEAAEVLGWHPNRLFVAVLEFLLPRLTQSLPPRRLKGKQFNETEWVAALTHDPLCHTRVIMTSAMRISARDTFRRWQSRVVRRSIRHISAASSITWQALDDEGKSRWYPLEKLTPLSCIDGMFPQSGARPPTSRNELPSVGAVVPLGCAPKVSGWGYLATYNTNIGVGDPMVLRWVQEGLRGEALRTKLLDHPLYRACFDRFWEWHQATAVSMGFETYCASMEHSEHARNPARIHLHAYAGVHISGGVGWMKSPRSLMISTEEMVWEGCRPHVRPTTTRRKADAAVFHAVTGGVYYVVGEKIGGMYREANAWPIQDGRLERC